MVPEPTSTSIESQTEIRGAAPLYRKSMSGDACKPFILIHLGLSKDIDRSKRLAFCVGSLGDE
jgi:hypothetical protein